MSSQTPDNDDSLPMGNLGWRQVILAGVVFGAFSVYEYFELRAWEQSGGIRLMSRWDKMAYDFGGKFGAVGLMGSMSLMVISVGIWLYFCEKNADANKK